MQKFARFNRLTRCLLGVACLTTVSIASAQATPAPTVSISASPITVTVGEQSRITWSSTNATACTAAGDWTGSKPLSDSKNTGQLTTNEVFSLTCTGPGGSATNQVTVAVVGGTSPKPTVSVTASPATITSGSRTLISWSTTHATACTAAGDWTGSKPLSGAKNTGWLTSDEVFALTCTGPGGSATNQVTVAVVSAPVGVPTVSITATPTTITSGSRTLITWSTTNATACTATGDWTGSKPLSGAKNTGLLTTDEVFALTCTGPAGTASQSATVTVAAAPPTTGEATLSWSAPTTNTNGTPVVPLAGYHVYYGNTASTLTKSIAVSGANTTSAEISGLAAGTWFFAVAADASDGTEGPQSAIGSLTI
jgi:hypothetical protein